MEFPLFHGDNAATWLDECDSIFHLLGIQNEAKVKWANAHIRGRAKTWLSSTDISIYLMNWHQFCELLVERFPTPGEHDTMEQFQHLKQQTFVYSYIDTFEDYIIRMRKDHPNLIENFFLLRFISILKDTVKHAVKIHAPPTLKLAY
jgi:hypothetical protein